MVRQGVNKRSPIRRFMQIAFVALLIASGCAQKEPPQGEYRVSVTPTQITLDVRGNATARATIDVSVLCIGSVLPPNCNQRDPDWAINGTVLFVANCELTDPHAPNTQLVIEASGYDPTNTELTNSPGEARAYASVWPRNEPRGFDITGNTTIDIRILYDVPANTQETHDKDDEEDEQGEDSEPPTLGLYPKNGWNFQMGGDAPADKDFMLANNGFQWQGDFTISQIRFSGPDASLFSLVPPPALPLVMGPYDTTNLTVHCEALTDLDPHSATMEIINDNGSRVVPLTAKRDW